MKKLLTLTLIAIAISLSACFYQRAVEQMSYAYNCDEDEIEVLDTNVKRSGDYYTLSGCGYTVIYLCTKHGPCEEVRRVQGYSSW